MTRPRSSHFARLPPTLRQQCYRAVVSLISFLSTAETVPPSASVRAVFGPRDQLLWDLLGVFFDFLLGQPTARRLPREIWRFVAPLLGVRSMLGAHAQSGRVSVWARLSEGRQGVVRLVTA